MKFTLLPLLVITTSWSQPPLTVSDYYRLMTNDQLPLTATKDGKSLSVEERLKLVTVRDEKNGYLEVKAGEIEAMDRNPVVALFNRKKGAPLIAVSYAADHATLRFFTYEQSKWSDVTDMVMPKLEDSVIDRRAQERIPLFKKEKRRLSDSASGTIDYILPRRGTKISIICAGDPCPSRTELFSLKFDGERFTLN